MEFRKMRRAAQELDHEACLEMIQRATSGVLSVIGDGGYPYGVPLSFVYVDGKDGSVEDPVAAGDGSVEDPVAAGDGSAEDPVAAGVGSAEDPVAAGVGSAEDPVAAGVGSIGKFYFHCAKTGHKIDALRACDKACFTIIDRDDVVADEFTTYFKSVIAFGHVRILETREEIMPAIRMLADRYSPDESDEKKSAEINREFAGLAMLELTVEHMTGKEAVELMRKRKKYE